MGGAERNCALTPYLALTAVLLLATPAEALESHYLYAQVGNSTESISDFTYADDEDFVQATFNGGDPETGAVRTLVASADSASGVLLVTGVSNDWYLRNQSRGFARIEERMLFPGTGTLPQVVDVLLVLTAGGAGGFISFDATLELGGCLVGIRQYAGSSEPAVLTDSGCDDGGIVDWEVSGGAGALHIVATYSVKRGTLDLGAEVSGDFGGRVSDIPTGAFSTSGTLSVSTQGYAASYESETFLTVPEPGAAVSVVAALAALARLRSRRR